MRFGIFDEYIFDEDIFDCIDIYDDKAPGAVPLNAYKQYKRINSRGETYYGFDGSPEGTGEVQL